MVYTHSLYHTTLCHHTVAHLVTAPHPSLSFLSLYYITTFIAYSNSMSPKHKVIDFFFFFFFCQYLNDKMG